jgi:hypothetical protein
VAVSVNMPADTHLVWFKQRLSNDRDQASILARRRLNELPRFQADVTTCAVASSGERRHSWRRSSPG